MLILVLLAFENVKAQVTVGPEYIKAELTNSGVFNSPVFEFSSAYDSYNTSTANSTIKGMFFEGLPYSFAKNGYGKTIVFCWYGVPTYCHFNI